MSLMTVEFQPTYVKIIDSSQSGKTSVKTVSVQSFVEAINANVGFSKGYLPPGTFHYVRRENHEIIAFEVSARVRDVRYTNGRRGHDDRYFTVPVPRLIAAARLQNNDDGYATVTEVHLGALAGPVVGPSTLVYKFPYPNVHMTVCWGGNVLPRYKIGEYQGLASLIDLFFESSFNDDLDGHFRTFDAILDGKQTRVVCFPQLAEFLSGKDTFPEEILSREGDLAAWLHRVVSRW